ncbi:intradiol ring-cleavage dioxygenase domain-containing protein [Flammeovirgaceae bacterium 311]|nr:intradiol ring-cleavage dioxygenase domain-containing protein [Flammeovirgaceae bacterium 311]
MKKGFFMLMKFFMLMTICLMTTCQAQDQQEKQKATARIGGPCEGCEAIYEWGDRKLSPLDTLPDFGEQGPKLKLTGTIYKQDGKTPASDVILYIYHTDQQGRYPTRGNEQGWDKRHGYLRGWIKTGADGKYIFYTQKPGAYPERNSPAHIHATVKEPAKGEYYIDDYVFEDDPLLDLADHGSSPRGGSGIISLRKEGDIWVAERDIILGLNIPAYD